LAADPAAMRIDWCFGTFVLPFYAELFARIRRAARREVRTSKVDAVPGFFCRLAVFCGLTERCFDGRVGGVHLAYKTDRQNEPDAKQVFQLRELGKGKPSMSTEPVTQQVKTRRRENRYLPDAASVARNAVA
jgi:hypothetical protein